MNHDQHTNTTKIQYITKKFCLVASIFIVNQYRILHNSIVWVNYVMVFVVSSFLTWQHRHKNIHVWHILLLLSPCDFLMICATCHMHNGVKFMWESNRAYIVRDHLKPNLVSLWKKAYGYGEDNVWCQSYLQTPGPGVHITNLDQHPTMEQYITHKESAYESQYFIMRVKYKYG